MADVCLDFEDLLVEIKLQYLDKKEEISDQIWYAANAAYSKLSKHYTKINSENFAIATVLDSRYKLDIYDTTQDQVELKESAALAIKFAFERYALPSDENSIPIVTAPANNKRKRFAKLTNTVKQDELATYLSESLWDENDDPLTYWRLNKTRFPILSKMARALSFTAYF